MVIKCILMGYIVHLGLIVYHAELLTYMCKFTNEISNRYHAALRSFVGWSSRLVRKFVK